MNYPLQNKFWVKNLKEVKHLVSEPKRVTIKKQVDSLDEITGLLKNRLKGIDDNSNLGQYNIKGNVSLIKNNKLDNSNEIDNLKKYYNQ